MPPDHPISHHPLHPIPDGLIIRTLATGDEPLVHAAAHLFDAPPQLEATARFLASPDHHLLIAYLDETPTGFISGVELTHPDKGTEMFIYELGVDEAYRRQGIAHALVRAMDGLARERGCYAAWVLTEPDNVAAIATYRGVGATDPEASLMFSWSLEDQSRG